MHHRFLSSKMKRGCRDCEQWMEHCYWNHFPKCKSFLKTLAGDFSKRLTLPKNFATYLKEFEFQTVRLKGPAGDKWTVGLKERKGYLCFQDGWKEVIHAYNLVENDKLLFKHDGKSKFSFSVYDATGEEKESTCFFEDRFCVEEECEEMEHEDTLELDFPPPNPGDIVPHNGEGHIILVPKPEHVEASEPEEIREIEDTSSRKRTKKSAKLSKNTSGQKTLPPGSSAEREQALVLASDFEPTRPSFKSVMKNYNVPPKGFSLLLNSDFARKYLPKANDDVNLCIPGGEKKWKVNYRIYKGGTVYMFVGNWKIFAEDNSLEEGDVLLFEQTEEDALLDVHIFRAKVTNQ